MSNIDTENEGPKLTPKKGDKVEVIRILILAVVSFVLGFGLVIFFLGPGTSDAPDDLPDLSGEAGAKVAAAPPSASAADAPEVEASTGYAPNPGDNPLLPASAESGESSNGASPSSGEAADEASAPPEVPPGRTPENVSLDGSAFYLKCWDANDSETPGESCDHLTVLEKRMATRLYVIDRCKQEHAGEKAEGKLSLGVEVDFAKGSISFWNGPSSTLENAAKVATCLRTELNGLPITGVEHKVSRYRLFFTVLFGAAKKDGSASKSAATGGAADDVPTQTPPVGKTATVVMDQVRVRKAPVDGDIIGKMGKDNQVKLLGKKGEWCRVLTPNNHEGWMICEALSK